jgi:isoleucyl-tRNA synthetase
MLTSIATKGEAPYRQIITHGWTVDGEGKAMHKSLGNTVAPESVIKDYGADILRLWVSSSDYRADVRISADILKQLSDIYLKIRNTARYILGNLSGFDPNSPVAFEDMTELDKWAVIRLNKLVERVRAAYDRYEYHVIYHGIHNFCAVEMSSFYLDVIKDRLYCDATGSLSRRSAQTAIYMILDSLVRLLARFSRSRPKRSGRLCRTGARTTRRACSSIPCPKPTRATITPKAWNRNGTRFWRSVRMSTSRWSSRAPRRQSASLSTRR